MKPPTDCYPGCPHVDIHLGVSCIACDRQAEIAAWLRDGRGYAFLVNQPRKHDGYVGAMVGQLAEAIERGEWRKP